MPTTNHALLRDLKQGDQFEYTPMFRIGAAPCVFLVERTRINDTGKQVVQLALTYFGVSLGKFTAVVSEQGDITWAAH